MKSVLSGSSCAERGRHRIPSYSADIETWEHYPCLVEKREGMVALPFLAEIGVVLGPVAWEMGAEDSFLEFVEMVVLQTPVKEPEIQKLLKKTVSSPYLTLEVVPVQYSTAHRLARTLRGFAVVAAVWRGLVVLLLPTAYPGSWSALGDVGSESPCRSVVVAAVGWQRPSVLIMCCVWACR